MRYVWDRSGIFMKYSLLTTKTQPVIKKNSFNGKSNVKLTCIVNST